MGYIFSVCQEINTRYRGLEDGSMGEVLAKTGPELDPDHPHTIQAWCEMYHKKTKTCLKSESTWNKTLNVGL